MPAPKGNKNAIGNKGGGRPTAYKPEYAAMAEKIALLGATDAELAEVLDVSETTINAWKVQFVEFSEALKKGKKAADGNVAERLYQRAMGYSNEKAVKIFMPAGAEEPVYAPFTEHYPPDTTACIFWLKNRRPDLWRDKRELDLKTDKTPLDDLDAATLRALADALGSPARGASLTNGKDTRH